MGSRSQTQQLKRYTICHLNTLHSLLKSTFTFFSQDINNTTDIQEDHVVHEICHMNILELAKKRFGGVTSLTTIYDPSEIIFTGKQGEFG